MSQKTGLTRKENNTSFQTIAKNAIFQFQSFASYAQSMHLNNKKRIEKTGNRVKE